MGARSINHWTTREVPPLLDLARIIKTPLLSDVFPSKCYSKAAICSAKAAVDGLRVLIWPFSDRDGGSDPSTPGSIPCIHTDFDPRPLALRPSSLSPWARFPGPFPPAIFPLYALWSWFHDVSAASHSVPPLHKQAGCPPRTHSPGMRTTLPPYFHSFTHKMSTECLLSFRYEGYSSKQNNPCLSGKPVFYQVHRCYGNRTECVAKGGVKQKLAGGGRAGWERAGCC